MQFFLHQNMNSQNHDSVTGMVSYDGDHVVESAPHGLTLKLLSSGVLTIHHDVLIDAYLDGSDNGMHTDVLLKAGDTHSISIDDGRVGVIIIKRVVS